MHDRTDNQLGVYDISGLVYDIYEYDIWAVGTVHT